LGGGLAENAQAQVIAKGNIGEPIMADIQWVIHGREFANCFEFKKAEIGRGWSKTNGPIALDLAYSYGQFVELHLYQDGIIP
jgi:hypothetical protein